MKVNPAVILITSVTVILLFSGIYPDFSRQEAIDMYKSEYLTTRLTGIEWNGSVEKCNAGKLDEATLEKALRRINYFRRVVGVRPVTLNLDFNEKSQHAALIMAANNQLSHNPPKSWKCYSEKGQEGAANSNLGQADFHFFMDIAFLTGFILDYGAGNNSCGHRKWLLNSRSKEMGYGATGSYEALYVTAIESDYIEKNTRFIAYPPAGYFPGDLVFDKWTFSIPAGIPADMKNADVKMHVNNKKINLKILDRGGPWYFDQTLVWQVTDFFSEEEITYNRNSLKERGLFDVPIRVEISGLLVNGKQEKYAYEINIFDPENP